MRHRVVPLLRLVLLLWAPARADCVASAISESGPGAMTVEPEPAFNMGVVLATSGSDLHGSAPFRVRFSLAGLVYQFMPAVLEMRGGR